MILSTKNTRYEKMYVYLLAADNGIAKVGKTKNLMSRFSTLKGEFRHQGASIVKSYFCKPYNHHEYEVDLIAKMAYAFKMTTKEYFEYDMDKLISIVDREKIFIEFSDLIVNNGRQCIALPCDKGGMNIEEQMTSSYKLYEKIKSYLEKKSEWISKGVIRNIFRTSSDTVFERAIDKLSNDDEIMTESSTHKFRKETIIKFKHK